jgi:threonine aldolase
MEAQTSLSSTATLEMQAVVAEDDSKAIPGPLNSKQLSLGPGNAWCNPMPAAYDFRSDYVTVPTVAMLDSIVATTLQDDVGMEDATTNSFQAFIATLTGHQDALFVLSGTMGNQVALRAALTMSPYSVVADQRSHIVRMEIGGPATLCGAQLREIVPSNGHHLTLEDIKSRTTVSATIYDCPTRVICLENTLGGVIFPLAEVARISRWARSQDPPIHMHLDGARIWEAVAAGAGSLSDYCELFDSVQLCLTKGLGAPIGSVIVGSREFVHRARWMRKMVGGGMRAAGVLTAPARVAVQDVFLGGKLERAQRIALSIGQRWIGLGGKLAKPIETNMVWLDLENAAGFDKANFFSLANQAGIRMMQGMLEGRIVVHYQICDDAVQRLFRIMADSLTTQVGL